MQNSTLDSSTVTPLQVAVKPQSIDLPIIVEQHHDSQLDPKVAHFLSKQKRSYDKTSKFYNSISEDRFCSGLVTKVFTMRRHIRLVPVTVCIISHSGIVVETTRNKAYLVEFVECYRTLIHDVTTLWDFSGKNKILKYSDIPWFKEDRGINVPVVSYNVQYVAMLFAAASDAFGDYVMSGNNCHMIQEYVRHQLGLAELGELDYSTFFATPYLSFDPVSEQKPFFFY